jgi:NADPH:quinone reductase-like Zn-dependent oxidoreductase
MNRVITMHRLRPVIDRTFAFAEARDAYRHFEGRGHFGKVVIRHDRGEPSPPPLSSKINRS